MGWQRFLAMAKRRGERGFLRRASAMEDGGLHFLAAAGGNARWLFPRLELRDRPKALDKTLILWANGV
jgi:hypothetical protein